MLLKKRQQHNFCHSDFENFVLMRVSKLICIMCMKYSHKHEIFEVAVAKEDKKCKVFLYFYAS